MFARIKDDLGQLTVDYLREMCCHFDTIINCIEDSEKLKIADQIIKFLKYFPLEKEFIQKRIEYLHLVAKIEEKRGKEQKKSFALLYPHFTS